MSKGPINIESLIDEQHFTQPPPRYSEASLVKKLEELGIGRPSTYASIISTIANRGYAEILNKRFFPTDRGKLISAFLEKLFSKYVDYNFTASLEDQLDEITTGKESWIRVLELFWKDFNNNVSEVKEKRTREVLDLLNDSLGALIFDKDTDGKVVRKCQLCNDGSLSLKNSFRGGAFIGCSNYPECKFTRPLSKAKAAAQAQLAEPKFIGKHENGNDIYLKNGRFGPYLQYEKILEEIPEEKTTKKKKKKKKLKSDVNELLKNVSIPKGLVGLTHNKVSAYYKFKHKWLLVGYAIKKAGFSLEEQMGESGSPIIRDMIKEQLDGAGIKLSSDEHVIVEINPDDEYIIDGKHKALVLR